MGLSRADSGKGFHYWRARLLMNIEMIKRLTQICLAIFVVVNAWVNYYYWGAWKLVFSTFWMHLSSFHFHEAFAVLKTAKNYISFQPGACYGGPRRWCAFSCSGTLAEHQLISCGPNT
jgi:hypothetical protein